MDKNYYLEYYELERAHWWFLARTKLLETQIQKLLKPISKPKILNIGAATGASTLWLQQFGEVVSVEYEKDCIAFVKEKCGLVLEEGSILALNFAANSFDLVCAFDVVEHVADEQLAMQEMNRVCAPNGHVVVTVPCFMSLWSKHDEVNHHFKRYTLAELEDIAPTALEKVFASYFNSILFIPIYLVRKTANLFPKLLKREGTGSDFGLVKSKILNNFFYLLFVSENIFLRNKISLPFGVSAMAIWKKNQF